MRRAGIFAATLTAGLGLFGCSGDDSARSVGGPGVEALVRPDTPNNNLQFKFDPGDVVETFASPGGDILVHFTQAGPNSVPTADADTSGVPDFVEEVATVYDEVVLRYRDELGFRAPVKDDFIADNGGDDRFDVYLVDFAGVGDGTFQKDQCVSGKPDQCAGYMVQENDYKGYGYPSTLVANRILGSHEFFHAVQAAYDAGQSSIINEGSAVWATETFDSTLKDFEAFLPGYFDNVDRSLETPLPGPVDPFSYGAGIWFWFLEERYGEGTVRELWESLEDGAGGVADPEWYEALDPLLVSKGTTFADAFVEFASFNLYTGNHADPTKGYAAGDGYPKPKMEQVAAPYTDDQLRVFHSSTQYYALPPDGRAAIAAAVVPPPDVPDAADGLTVLLVADDGQSYGDIVKVADATAGTDTVDATGAQRVVVAVVNGNRTGDSKKPGLCIGSPDEVSACIVALGGGTGGGGGGGGEGGAGQGGSTSQPSAPKADTSDDDGGCGCRVAGAAPDRALDPAWLVAAAAALAAARRRSRG